MATMVGGESSAETLPTTIDGFITTRTNWETAPNLKEVYGIKPRIAKQFGRNKQYRTYRSTPSAVSHRGKWVKQSVATKYIV